MRHASCRPCSLALLLSVPPAGCGARLAGTIQGVVTLQGRPLDRRRRSPSSSWSPAPWSGRPPSANGGFEAMAAAGRVRRGHREPGRPRRGPGPRCVAVVPRARRQRRRSSWWPLPAAMLQDAAAAPPQPPATAPGSARRRATAAGPALCPDDRHRRRDPVRAGDLLRRGRVPAARRAHRARCRGRARAAPTSMRLGATSFYYVEMTQEEGRFFGKLPRPEDRGQPRSRTTCSPRPPSSRRARRRRSRRSSWRRRKTAATARSPPSARRAR